MIFNVAEGTVGAASEAFFSGLYEQLDIPDSLEYPLFGITLRGRFILTRITDMNKYLDALEIIEKKYFIKPSAKYLRGSYTDLSNYS